MLKIEHAEGRVVWAALRDVNKDAGQTYITEAGNIVIFGVAHEFIVFHKDTPWPGYHTAADLQNLFVRPCSLLMQVTPC